jgi:predicted  nucleic acid-binding Zn-ribbon protein
MLTAIGSFPTSNPVTTAIASTAAIEAQIARDKKALSNCVNCDSAKTKQGQADIQALTNKIRIAEARLREIANAKPVNQPTALNATAASEKATNSNAIASGAESATSDASATSRSSSDSHSGRLVDIFV